MIGIVPFTCYTVTFDTPFFLLDIVCFCHIIYLNIGHFDFLANVRMLKFGSELRYGIRSPNVRTPVDIPNIYIGNPFLLMLHIKFGFDRPSGFREEDV